MSCHIHFFGKIHNWIASRIIALFTNPPYSWSARTRRGRHVTLLEFDRPRGRHGYVSHLSSLLKCHAAFIMHFIDSNSIHQLTMQCLFMSAINARFAELCFVRLILWVYGLGSVVLPYALPSSSGRTSLRYRFVLTDQERHISMTCLF